MSKVIIGAVVSADGFIADRNDGVGPLFDWYFNGPQEVPVAPHQYRPKDGYRPAAASAEFLRATWASVGATIMGRRLFDLTDGWGGKPAVGDHAIVVTHRSPGDWPSRHPDAPFHFVSDLEEAVALAKQKAGARDVSLPAGDLAGQAICARLVDQIDMYVVPVLFGDGIRFFGEHKIPTTMLENPRIVQSDRVTHFSYDLRAL
ncbi:dihydrofolate reductase family protein [Nonomuraea aurantiaca]|uniref:dihydrofolate reductase family protein n=1 Tax=Nonomuraea aurantiaca TaxID=2878562 RepID=UPI001CD928FD|nr:dihydrofolate reductase family protein [Nonomuraea aurantiaca]MCA2226353.1 dihydrofolate reductase family protein [Nonomuraea aurantiaca]